MVEEGELKKRIAKLEQCSNIPLFEQMIDEAKKEIFAPIKEDIPFILENMNSMAISSKTKELVKRLLKWFGS